MLAFYLRRGGLVEKCNQRPVQQRVNDEVMQGHSTRCRLIEKVEALLDRPVLAYFTSFIRPVMIDDEDAAMLEDVLRTMDLTKGLALVINSPGGSGLAAERIIHLCRQYSGTSEYFAVVPNKAKSAATMVCLGASKIFMGISSELGPIDPQITVREGDSSKIFSVCNLVDSYKKLFDRAIKTKGNLEPFLQQLNHYDERAIKEMERAISLSEDIAIKSLKSGMLSSETEPAIRKKIKDFLTPEGKKDHGRPIYHLECSKAGLDVEYVKPEDELWGALYELHVRGNRCVSMGCTKLIETVRSSIVSRLV